MYGKCSAQSAEFESVGIVDLNVIVVDIRGRIMGKKNISRRKHHVASHVETLPATGMTDSQVAVRDIGVQVGIYERTGIPNGQVSVRKRAYLGIEFGIDRRGRFPRC